MDSYDTLGCIFFIFILIQKCFVANFIYTNSILKRFSRLVSKFCEFRFVMLIGKNPSNIVGYLKSFM